MEWDRTTDAHLFRVPLYQLSYRPATDVLTMPEKNSYVNTKNENNSKKSNTYEEYNKACEGVRARCAFSLVFDIGRSFVVAFFFFPVFWVSS